MPRLSLLADLAAILPRQIDLDQLLGEAAERIAEALNAERATIWLVDSKARGLVTQIAMLPEVPQLVQPLGKGVSGYVAETGETVAIDDVEADDRFDPSADQETGYKTRNTLAVPIRHNPVSPVRGVLQVLNKRAAGYEDEDVEYLGVLAQQLADILALTSLRAADLDKPGVTLRGRYNRVIGNSEAMQKVYEQVALIAETDATVLLTGETGTGKGVIARAIHDNSPRRAGPFVVVDATTLPKQLVESELFGHERGAFTGATARVLGKVERAEGGTLFIDELGDLPLELQGKLLRLLQDREFERVGGGRTLKADVRILCATHRDLRKLTEEGAFRRDLYYRVRVVHVDVPALRERGAEEITLLANHFGHLYASAYGRVVPHLGRRVLDRLHAHEWPGNVRELEHWVESAVVLHPNGILDENDAPSADRDRDSTQPGPKAGLPLPLGLSLDEVTRRYVKATLDEANGNKTEAARRLGIGRNKVARILKK